MKELTSADPVHHRRVGYPGTGYAFHLVRCLDHAALRDYVKKIPGVLREPWFSGSEKEIPDGFTACRSTTVLKGIVPEAVGDFLCEAHLVVVAVPGAAGAEWLPGPRREELRRWRHEIGHAVDFCHEDEYWKAFRAGIDLHFDGKNSGMFDDLDDEFPAFCNEFLCEAVDAMMSGDAFAAASGFRTVFPWVAQ